MTQALVLFILALLCAPVEAAVGKPFEQEHFDALMKEGRPVLVWFHVDWCPTCRAQDKILKDLLSLPQLRSLTLLRVDFDTQKEEALAFRAIRQGTFILFKGGKEVGRSLGGTFREDILEFLRPAF
jgi:thiol-disulfide isomerase/thioredoxin